MGKKKGNSAKETAPAQISNTELWQVPGFVFRPQEGPNEKLKYWEANVQTSPSSTLRARISGGESGDSAEVTISQLEYGHSAVESDKYAGGNIMQYEHGREETLQHISRLKFTVAGKEYKIRYIDSNATKSNIRSGWDLLGGAPTDRFNPDQLKTPEEQLRYVALINNVATLLSTAQIKGATTENAELFQKTRDFLTKAMTTHQRSLRRRYHIRQPRKQARKSASEKTRQTKRKRVV